MARPYPSAYARASVTWIRKRAITVGDFGEQWTRYTRNTGYYASSDSLASLFGPLLDAGALAGSSVADVGAGTGRFTRMFHELGARQILALEPSDAIDTLERNTADLDGVRCLRATADQTPPEDFDYVFCIGVLQFIPEPVAALRAMGRALKPHGDLFVWVYGRENNTA